MAPHPEKDTDDFVGGFFVNEFTDHQCSVAVHGRVNIDKLRVVTVGSLSIVPVAKREYRIMSRGYGRQRELALLVVSLWIIACHNVDCCGLTRGSPTE